MRPFRLGLKMCIRDRLSRAVWVYGERALAGAEPFLPAAFHLPEAKKILFTGHLSLIHILSACATPLPWAER